MDTDKIETSMVVFCSVSLESQKLEAIEIFNKAVKKITEVIECYPMGGANDFLLKVVVKDLQAYHKLLLVNWQPCLMYLKSKVRLF